MNYIIESIDAVREEVTRHLQNLIRINTTNPPGNELAVVKYLADVLKKEGIDSIILESAPQRGNLVARLKGTGEKAPLLLMGHSDVVPAVAEEWTYPPFSGEIHDGFVWGRGAVDMKGMVAMELMLMLLFKRQQDAGAPPFKRDLILMIAADEEQGGVMGAAWLAKHHPDLIRAEYAINEGAGYGFEFENHLYYTCQTAEKGGARFRLIAKGTPGHGSIPRKDNAIMMLAQAVQKMGQARLPVHITSSFQHHIQSIAAPQDEPLRANLLKLIDPDQTDAVLEILPLSDIHRGLLYAMSHNTAVPTILKAGNKINVVPGTAEAHFDGRVLPGFDPDSFFAELKPFIDEQVRLEFLDSSPSLEAPVESPLYDLIKRNLEKHEPNATLIPLLLVAGTDAKNIVQLGTKIYGFAPLKWENDPRLIQLTHAPDERISINSLVFGVRVLYDVVSQFGQE